MVPPPARGGASLKSISLDHVEKTITTDTALLGAEDGCKRARWQNTSLVRNDGYPRAPVGVALHERQAMSATTGVLPAITAEKPYELLPC